MSSSGEPISGRCVFWNGDSCWSVTHLGGNKYQASVSEETLVGMNNAQGSVRLTIKNLKTQLGLMMDDFFIEFTPVNLVPIEIPLPVVEEVWNE